MPIELFLDVPRVMVDVMVVGGSGKLNGRTARAYGGV